MEQMVVGGGPVAHHPLNLKEEVVDTKPWQTTDIKPWGEGGKLMSPPDCELRHGHPWVVGVHHPTDEGYDEDHRLKLENGRVREYIDAHEEYGVNYPHPEGPQSSPFPEEPSTPMGFSPDGMPMHKADGGGGGGGNAKKSTSRRNAWGNLSYADLITSAIQSSPEKRLTLSQVYDWMVQNIPYFKDKGDSNSSAGWKVGQVGQVGCDASVHTCTYSSVQWTSHVLQATRTTRPCLTGHLVVEIL